VLLLLLLLIVVVVGVVVTVVVVVAQVSPCVATLDADFIRARDVADEIVKGLEDPGRVPSFKR